MNTEEHYQSDESLYMIAEKLGLNAWEFDIFKRVVRCRKKGQFRDDLRKIKNTADIYLHEFKSSDLVKSPNNLESEIDTVLQKGVNVYTTKKGDLKNG